MDCETQCNTSKHRTCIGICFRLEILETLNSKREISFVRKIEIMKNGVLVLIVEDSHTQAEQRRFTLEHNGYHPMCMHVPFATEFHLC